MPERNGRPPRIESQQQPPTTTDLAATAAGLSAITDVSDRKRKRQPATTAPDRKKERKAEAREKRRDPATPANLPDRATTKNGRDKKKKGRGGNTTTDLLTGRVAKKKRGASGGGEFRDWSSLHKDIMEVILGNLPLLADYDRFGSVCRSWQQASRQNREKRMESQISPSFPLLLLPADRPTEFIDCVLNYILPPQSRIWKRHYHPWARSLYDLFRRKILLQEFTLGSVLGHNPDLDFIGSSHGWLVHAAVTGPCYELNLTLVNPFYFGGGSRSHGGIIRLPPLLNCAYHFLRCKVVLSADPALAPDDYLVSFIGSKILALAKSGDKCWEYLSMGMGGASPQDVIFRSSTIYIVANSGYIKYFDTMDPDPKVTVIYPALGRCEDTQHYYIVESPNHGLLLLHRSKENKFRVFQFVEQQHGQQAWHEINTLGGDMVILVGRSHSTCFRVSPYSNDLPGFRPNSIYFDEDGGLCELKDCPHQSASFEGTGIFSLDNHSVHQCYHLREQCSGLDIMKPIWFLPSLPGSWRRNHP